MGEKTVQVAVRIPESWIARADKLTGRLTMTPEIQVNRTDVLRAAIGRGLDALENQYGAPPTEPTADAQKGGTRPARKPKPSK
jgi:hypothetical protein